MPGNIFLEALVDVSACEGDLGEEEGGAYPEGESELVCELEVEVGIKTLGSLSLAENTNSSSLATGE